MSYGTEEVIPMFGGKQTSKNQSFGLVAFMVLCVAVTSFMAGHASNRAATASTLGWSKPESCSRWKNDMRGYCSNDVFECLLNAWYGDGKTSEATCMDSVGQYSSCKWAFDIMQETCDF